MKRINKELLKDITILFVDDEDMVREEVSYFFSNYVKEFYTASNGEEGYSLFKEVNPDIIITDIQMPKMNGLEMIKKIDKKVPVIVTTAYSDSSYFLSAIELDVNKFILKPIDLRRLILDVQDCISKSNLREKLFEKQSLLNIVDENVLLSITDKNGTIIDASHAFTNFVGYTKDELLGNTHQLLRHEDTKDSFYENMWKEISNGKVFSKEIKNRKKYGEEYWAKLTITPVFNNDDLVNYIAIRQDITNKKKLELLSIIDELTQLYNRRYFNKIIDKEIRRIKRTDSSISLLCMDIDYFKLYNDKYGHPAGDNILNMISKVIKESALRATDYSFRIGGEEFAVIFSGMSIEESLDFSKEIVTKVENMQIEHLFSKLDSKTLTISAGLTVLSSDYITNVEEIYAFADKALYNAKLNGRNRVVLCTNSR